MAKLNSFEELDSWKLARGSSCEVKSQLYILLDLGYIDEQKFTYLYSKTSDISKTLLGLINYLRNLS
jgi:four helix bundle protein